MAKPIEIIKYEKAGRLHEWSLFKKPVRGTRSEQQAYARGFRARVQDWCNGQSTPVTVDYRRVVDRKAYERGYEDARLQEPK